MDNSELIKHFGQSGKHLIEMADEISKLETKYPHAPNWLLLKRKQVDDITNFYDAVRGKLVFYEKCLNHIQLQNRVMKGMAYKAEMNISFEQLGKLQGESDLKKLQSFDSLDAKLNDIMSDIL